MAKTLINPFDGGDIEKFKKFLRCPIMKCDLAELFGLHIEEMRKEIIGRSYKDKYPVSAFNKTACIILKEDYELSNKELATALNVSYHAAGQLNSRATRKTHQNFLNFDEHQKLKEILKEISDNETRRILREVFGLQVDIP